LLHPVPYDDLFFLAVFGAKVWLWIDGDNRWRAGMEYNAVITARFYCGSYTYLAEGQRSMS
jgi:hypothetical protein